ncbi:MAG: hypothetical protein FK734_03665 [Asgard group archaeon]|nr:hypothetical protein [Asgard group archaeon]
MNDDWYVLQSGFFVALSNFASEMTNDRLKYVILENRLYALDEVSDVLVIFGDKQQMTQEVIDKLKNNLLKATNHLNSIFAKYKVRPETTITNSLRTINDIANEFGDYLKNEQLVEDDHPFDPLASRSLMQKFIFKSIGYQPGQCNIGRAERLKRLLTGIPFLIIGVIGALIMWFYQANPFWAFLLAVPFFMFFFGLFQYFFKFCAVNGLTKKYDMR